ncbi:hypothetical protein EYF80_011626 [Liparis tanakae]|uniref:Uncharacterized protein n=1 Tax=Liparis tanakae TaxID=230148 RepID=A0A4Z2IK30_9TELE|nr:hypothetical protein EYF80_011626 [Liparis tanakae]
MAVRKKTLAYMLRVVTELTILHMTRPKGQRKSSTVSTAQKGKAHHKAVDGRVAVASVAGVEQEQCQEVTHKPQNTHRQVHQGDDHPHLSNTHGTCDVVILDLRKVQRGLLGEDVEPAVQRQVQRCEVLRCSGGAEKFGELALILLSSAQAQGGQGSGGAAVALHDSPEGNNSWVLLCKVTSHGRFSILFAANFQRDQGLPAILVVRRREVHHGEICPGSELLHHLTHSLNASGDGEERNRSDVSHFIHRLQGAGRH